jgi:hypothetical protein
MPSDLVTRRAAARLLPRSKRMMAERLADQRDVVLGLRLRWAAAATPVEKAALSRKLGAELIKLRRLTDATKLSALDTPGVMRITPFAAQALITAIIGEIRQVEAALAGNGIKAFPLRRTRLQVRRRFLRKRLRLLRTGFDIERPVRLAPHLIKIPRVALVLPEDYELPTAAETATLTRLVGLALVRRPGEPQKQFRDRLRAYVQRALVRFVLFRRRLKAEQAIPAAIEETVRVDAPALEAEVTAGGIAADPVAEQMEPVTMETADTIATVAIDLQPPVPAETIKEPTAAEVDQAVVQASVVADDLANAPVEPADQAAALLLDDSPPEPEQPFYLKRPFLVGAAVGVGLWFMFG